MEWKNGKLDKHWEAWLWWLTREKREESNHTELYLRTMCDWGPYAEIPENHKKWIRTINPWFEKLT